MLYDKAFYVDNSAWSAVTAWATGAAKSAGDLVRQNAAPAVGSERVFVCIVAGTTHATTEPTWNLTRGAKTTDNSVTWQECTGLAGLNGDDDNTPTWTEFSNNVGAADLGQLIKSDAGTHYFICTTAGSSGGAEPTWNTTAGATTADSSITWTSLGAVGNFSGGDAPHRRIGSAVPATGFTVINEIKVFVISTHEETSTAGATVELSDAMSDFPLRILSHNGGAYPPLAANLASGAKISNTTAGAIALRNHADATYVAALYVEGVVFNQDAAAAINVGVTGAGTIHCKNCTFDGATSTSHVTLSGAGARLLLENCTFTLGHSSARVSVGTGKVEIFGGTGPNTTPGRVFTLAGSVDLFVTGFDLSGVTGGSQRIVDENSVGQGLARFANCKISDNPTHTYNLNAQVVVELINCDWDPTSYKYRRNSQLATVQPLATSPVMSGGASDGTTNFSWQLTVGAGDNYAVAPLECPPISKWNADVGSPITCTIEGTWGGGSPPENDEIWVEFEYHGDPLTPHTSFVSTAPATVLTAPAAYAASSAVWNGSTSEFKMEATFTPELAGWITARVKAARKSSTFFVNPQIIIS